MYLINAIFKGIMPKRKNENAEADGCEDGPAVKYGKLCD